MSATFPEWFGFQATPGARIYEPKVWRWEGCRLNTVRLFKGSRLFVTDASAAFAVDSSGFPTIANHDVAARALARLIRTAKPAEWGEIKLYTRKIGSWWFDLDYLAIGYTIGARTWDVATVAKPLHCVGAFAVGRTEDGRPVALIASLDREPGIGVCRTYSARSTDRSTAQRDERPDDGRSGVAAQASETMGT